MGDVPLALRSCGMLRHIAACCGENDATWCARGAALIRGVNAALSRARRGAPSVLSQ